MKVDDFCGAGSGLNDLTDRGAKSGRGIDGGRREPGVEGSLCRILFVSLLVCAMLFSTFFNTYAVCASSVGTREDVSQ